MIGTSWERLPSDRRVSPTARNSVEVELTTPPSFPPRVRAPQRRPSSPIAATARSISLSSAFSCLSDPPLPLSAWLGPSPLTMLALARSSRPLRASTSSASALSPSTSQPLRSPCSAIGRGYAQQIPHGLVGGSRDGSLQEYERPLPEIRRADRKSPAAVFGQKKMPAISIPSELENKMERLFGGTCMISQGLRESTVRADR